jgi:hypothetical protein
MIGMTMRRTVSRVLLLITVGAGAAIVQQRDTTGSDSTQRGEAARSKSSSRIVGWSASTDEGPLASTIFGWTSELSEQYLRDR